MNDKDFPDKPEILSEIQKKSEEVGFSMPSDLHIGSLLKTLITAKPKANLLELGTGIGLSLAWMIDAMDQESRITTIDNDPELISIARNFFGQDNRVDILCMDGTAWIKQYAGEKFDLVFADTWPGKYNEVDKVLDMIKTGGFYVIDDMMSQPNWPDGHQDLVEELITYLENRKDFVITKMNWSTGVIIAAKK